MLTSSKKSTKSTRKIQRIKIVKKSSHEVYSFNFPIVQGLEDISTKLNAVFAESPFAALLQIYNLHSVDSEVHAKFGERLLEYLGRAFVPEMPSDVQNYAHLLEMLLKEFDDKHYARASLDMAPHEFLKAILKEENMNQKQLVPEFFHSESQVSEFLRQKKGRQKLSYPQAYALGKRFHVDPKVFLTLSGQQV